MLARTSSRNSRAIVQKTRPDRFAVASQANAQSSAVAGLANCLLRVHDQIQENLHQLVRIALNIRQPGLANEVYGNAVFPKRVGVQIKRAFHHILEIDTSFAGRRRGGKISQVMNNLRGTARLLLQYTDLLSRRVRGLAVLQQFTHAQDTGQRIVQFVRDSANHRAHGGQTFALHHLLLKFLFRSDVAYRNDDSREFGISIKELAGRGPHRTSTPIAVPHAILRRSKRPVAGNHIVTEREQLRRVSLGTRISSCPSNLRIGTRAHRARAN